LIVLKVSLLQESRADEGIYMPLIQALERDDRFVLTIIKKPEQLKLPNWLIVLGDRRAMLEATINAAYQNIPIAHIQGGDRTGTIDEPCRHAITRFAHLHFPCTPESTKRLIDMGEEGWRIRMVGPLGIYAMPEAEFFERKELCNQLGLDSEQEIILVIQHPVSAQVRDAAWQMRQTLDAVRDLQTVVIYPNDDPGSVAMIKEIEHCNWVKKFKTLSYPLFLSLLKESAVVVGNSSTGLYEAPLFGIPSINIGTRQQDRERGINVWDIDHDSVTLHSGIKILLRTRWEALTARNPFKIDIDGIKIIMDTLYDTPIDERLLQKRLTY